MRAKSLWLCLTVAAVTTSAFAVACGDDDDNNNNNGVVDGGNTETGPNTGDAGCTFAGFVTNLINTQTNGTAAPSADLGDTCTPSTTQDDFKSLFPAH